MLAPDIQHRLLPPTVLPVVSALGTLAILAVAVVGKWGGAAGSARLTGADWRSAAAIGTLMNCRGVTELPPRTT